MPADVSSTTVLLIHGALIHVSCALKCYNCVSYAGDYCDEPLTGSKEVQVEPCPTTISTACIIAKYKFEGIKTLCSNSNNKIMFERTRSLSNASYSS